MIVKGRRSLPFTQCANKTILDKSLSLQARMILIIMLTRPIDWCFSLSWIQNETGLSKDSIRKYLNELVAHKYLEKQKIHSKSTGRFIGWAYTVYECNDVEDWADTI